MDDFSLPDWAAPAKEPSAHRFFCVSFDNRVQEYKVGDQKYHLIGRAGAGATILLNHPETSRRHAVITQNAKGRFHVMDLGSKSGTWQNKNRLTPHTWYDWDVQSNTKVRFGDRKKDGTFDMAQLMLQAGTAQLRTAEQRAGATSRGQTDSTMQVDNFDKGSTSVGAIDRSTNAGQGQAPERLGNGSGSDSRETERKRCMESDSVNGLDSKRSESEPDSKRYKASNGMCQVGDVLSGKTTGGTAAESKASNSHETMPASGPQPSPPASPQQHKHQQQPQQQQQQLLLQQKKKQEEQRQAQQPLPQYGPELPPASPRAAANRTSDGALPFGPQKPKQTPQDTWSSGMNGRLSNGASGHGATGSNSRLRNGSSGSSSRLSNGFVGTNGRVSNGSSASANHGRLSNGSSGAKNGTSVCKELRPKCDKCDQPHPTEQCPHFKGGRDKHKDAWVNYGRKHPLEMGTSGGNFVLRRARHVRQPGDGSCLFHSLSFGLKSIGINGYENGAVSLRRQIASFIIRNASLEIAGDTIEEWVKWDSESSVKSYASRMANSGWGGGIEMAACARLKGVNIHVYQHRRGEYHRISCFDAPNAGRHTKTIHILYVGGMHYDALAV